MRRAGIALGFVASIVVGVAACGAPGAPLERSQASDEALRNLDDQEQAFLGLINQYRQSQGLAPLTATPLLNQVAYDHSNDMATNNYFDHNDQAGHSPFDRMKAAGYDGGWMAENIAAGNADAQSTFTQWKNSAGHNANMLGTHYVAIGIGRAYSKTSTYGWYWTTDFGDYVDDSVNQPGGTDAGTGSQDAGGGSKDAGAPDAAPPPPPPPPPPTGCNGTSGTPSHDYSHATPLDGTWCAPLAAGGEQDWFSWSAASAGVTYDVKVASSGDANVAMWKLVNGQYSRIANASPTEVNKTSTAAGSYLILVWSPSSAAQSYSVTLTH